MMFKINWPLVRQCAWKKGTMHCLLVSIWIALWTIISINASFTDIYSTVWLKWLSLCREIMDVIISKFFYMHFSSPLFTLAHFSAFQPTVYLPSSRPDSPVSSILLFPSMKLWLFVSRCSGGCSCGPDRGLRCSWWTGREIQVVRCCWCSSCVMCWLHWTSLLTVSTHACTFFHFRHTSFSSLWSTGVIMHYDFSILVISSIMQLQCLYTRGPNLPLEVNI